MMWPRRDPTALMGCQAVLNASGGLDGGWRMRWRRGLTCAGEFVELWAMVRCDAGPILRRRSRG